MPLVVRVEDSHSWEEALAEALCWPLGIDGTYGWHEELPSAESLCHPVEEWGGAGSPSARCLARRLHPRAASAGTTQLLP
jgi:hypothetical protein